MNSNVHLTAQTVATHYPFQHGDRLYTLESDVCRRQILTYKAGPRTEKNIYNGRRPISQVFKKNKKSQLRHL